MKAIIAAYNDIARNMCTLPGTYIIFHDWSPLVWTTEFIFFGHDADGIPVGRGRPGNHLRHSGHARWADDADHQIANEAVLHGDTNGKQSVDVGERGAGRKLCVGDIALEASAHVIRQENTTSKVRAWILVPCGAGDHTVEAQCFACTTRERASGSNEDGLRTHHRDKINEVRACAAVVVLFQKIRANKKNFFLS